MTETLTSLKNPRILAFRSLQERKGRLAHEAFLVEGDRLVREALSSSFPVRAVLLRTDREIPDWVSADLPLYLLPDHVFAAVAGTKTPQGIAAVIGMQPRPAQGHRLVALDGVQDPGNVGTILRTADAVGFDGAILSPECADVFAPKVLRATMGSIFRLGLSFPGSLPAFLREKREQGCSILSSQLDGTPFFSREGVAPDLILVIGNEGNGVSPEVRSEATHHLRLPMRGGAESLNAAVAAAVMMYDLTRDLEEN